MVKRMRLSSAMVVASSTHDLSLCLGLSLQSLSASDASFSPTWQFKLDYLVACYSASTASLAMATDANTADLQGEDQAPPHPPLFNSQIVSLLPA